MKRLKFESLQVGKGGFGTPAEMLGQGPRSPALFLIELPFRKSGGKPPFLTCEFVITESCTVRLALFLQQWGAKAAIGQSEGGQVRHHKRLERFLVY